MIIFILKFIAIIFWLTTFVFSTTLAMVLFLSDFTLPHLIPFAIFIGGSYFIGRFFWRKSKSTRLKGNKKTFNKKPKDTNNPIKVSTVSTHETPREILNDMNKFYSTINLQEDLRVLDDSISLMKSTKDIETFTSRSDLAMRKALTIEQARSANVSVPSNVPSSKEVMDLKFQLLPNVLNAAYIKVSNEVTKLKTVKGQLGRYQKFLNYLIDNEYELDLCDNYEEIVTLTQENISNLQIQLKSS